MASHLNHSRSQRDCAAILYPSRVESFLSPYGDDEFDFRTPITDDVTLYAQFSAKLSATFKDGDTVLSQEDVYHGDLLPMPNSPTRDGYTFDGWFTEDGGKYDFGDEVTEDLVLTAHWTKDDTVTEPTNPGDNGTVVEPTTPGTGGGAAGAVGGGSAGAVAVSGGTKTVAGVDLAQTGSDVTAQTGAMALLLSVGIALVVRRRAR